jgi:hypothetical protein
VDALREGAPGDEPNSTLAGKASQRIAGGMSAGMAKQFSDGNAHRENCDTAYQEYNYCGLLRSATAATIPALSQTSAEESTPGAPKR